MLPNAIYPQRLKWLEHEGDYTHPSCTLVNNVCRFAFTLTYIFMVGCLGREGYLSSALALVMLKGILFAFQSGSHKSASLRLQFHYILLFTSVLAGLLMTI
jgi:hypothetical protein